MTIGEEIKKARTKKGLTQKQLSEMTGIAEITIRQYEAGKYKPKLDKLKIISDALGASLVEIEDYIYYLIPLERTREALLAELCNIEKSLHSENLSEEDYNILSKTRYEKESMLEEVNKLIKNLNWEIAKEKDKKRQEERILKDYRKLNDEGKKEAMKRVNELTEVPKYQKKD